MVFAWVCISRPLLPAPLRVRTSQEAFEKTVQPRHPLITVTALPVPIATRSACRKVFEKLCDDFGSKRRERVVRLDVPLRAFDGPASSISNRLGGTRLTAAGTFVGPGGPALAAGLDDLCAGLRDSIRAAYEARKAAYEAEVGGLCVSWQWSTLCVQLSGDAIIDIVCA